MKKAKRKFLARKRNRKRMLRRSRMLTLEQLMCRLYLRPIQRWFAERPNMYRAMLRPEGRADILAQVSIQPTVTVAINPPSRIDFPWWEVARLAQPGDG